MVHKMRMACKTDHDDIVHVQIGRQHRSFRSFPQEALTALTSHVVFMIAFAGFCCDYVACTSFVPSSDQIRWLPEVVGTGGHKWRVFLGRSNVAKDVSRAFRGRKLTRTIHKPLWSTCSSPRIPSLGQPLTTAKWPLPIGVSLPRSQQHFKASREALNLVSFNLLYGDFGSKKDAEWQEHNGIHQFASYNG